MLIWIVNRRFRLLVEMTKFYRNQVHICTVSTHCLGGGGVVDDFLGAGGLATFFLTRS